MPAPPKHPSTRSRRRDGNRASFRVISGRVGRTPRWPLEPSIAAAAELEVLQAKVAALRDEVDAETDGRAKGRLVRALERNEAAAAALALGLERTTKAEQALWKELWSYPQAQLWEESKSHRSVALYVRCQIRAEQGDLKAATEARQREDRLGLNDRALLQLRAEVERVDEAEQRGTRRRTNATPDRAEETKPPAAKGPDPRLALVATWPPSGSGANPQHKGDARPNDQST